MGSECVLHVTFMLALVWMILSMLLSRDFFILCKVTQSLEFCWGYAVKHACNNIIK